MVDVPGPAAVGSDDDLSSAVRVWGYIGLNSFGGPAGQIAVIHREVVARRRWLDEASFVHALNFCMLLPGPEAQQLATYLGWQRHGVRGGVIAGGLFVLPGFAVMMALSFTYAQYGEVAWVAGALLGLQSAVVALVVQALLRVARRSLNSPSLVAIAVVAFVALSLLRIPFPVVIALAGLLGWLLGRIAPGEMSGRADRTDSGSAFLPAARRARRAAAWALGLWLVPVAALFSLLGRDHVFTQQALLFSKAAVVTFGGAYSVLAYVSHQAVEVQGWIEPSDMVTGLGLAETTPGPLIMVVQFVGFLAAFNNPGTLAPVVAGVIGGCVTVWVTFLPCFFFIFLGAPYIEGLRRSGALRHALAAIGAAVVGVIASLAVWFSLNAVFAVVAVTEIGPIKLWHPEITSLRWDALLLAVLALVLIFRLRISTGRVLALSALLGILLQVG